jgi:uncharacterized protein
MPRRPTPAAVDAWKRVCMDPHARDHAADRPRPAATTRNIAMATGDPDIDTLHIEAATFRRLRRHLLEQRPDVQNIDLMILAGFCRNCLADWYREAADARGIAMTRDEAREAVYGEAFADWKARHQREATPEQLAAFAAATGKAG